MAHTPTGCWCSGHPRRFWQSDLLNREQQPPFSREYDQFYRQTLAEGVYKPGRHAKAVDEEGHLWSPDDGVESSDDDDDQMYVVL